MKTTCSDLFHNFHVFLISLCHWWDRPGGHVGTLDRLLSQLRSQDEPSGGKTPVGHCEKPSVLFVSLFIHSNKNILNKPKLLPPIRQLLRRQQPREGRTLGQVLMFVY